MTAPDGMSPDDRREIGNTALDALAVIAALWRDDVESANVMFKLYADEGNAWDLVQSCMGHTTRLLRSFVPDPELALAAMAQAIRDNS